jgi:hypothetical protein
MEIANIKRFAEAYNDLRTYFNRIEPYEVRQVSLFPVVTGPYTSRIKKSFSADDWDIPCDSEAFRELYDCFIEALSNAVLEYSQQTVQVMLESYFSKSTNAFTNNHDNVFANSLSDIFKNNREDLIEIIELFNEATNKIHKLINGPKTEEAYGIVFLGSYDSFREEAIQKRLQRGLETKQVSANESAHKLSEKENRQGDITNYLNLDDNKKKEWIHQGMQYDTVKELAKFIAQSYADKILCKIPSKKGGGLWNLAKTAFQIEDTGTNRKTIENEFKLVYNPPLIPNKFK